MEPGTRHTALAFFHRSAEVFSDVIVVPDLAGFSSLWVEARDLNGMLGLQVHQRLLATGPRIIKRAVDLCAVLAGTVFALPLAIAIAVAIKLTSPGPVFYRQTRLGSGGRSFTAWKFRSMVDHANAALDQCLNTDAALRHEWLQFQKLRDDPRITPVGRFLRHTSLDELPQLWNILRGQMSLVGPRPIVEEETSRYGDAYALYKKVRPGLTGLWQVSGRNHLSYEERVTLDTYYIRNWSPWLDLYILARTVAAVLLARGAY
jgi:Undecaprenyl-phosphate galactose phosphotransferase WbaP